MADPKANEKTEQASTRRLRDFRERGEIPRSSEFQQAAMQAGILGASAWILPHLWQNLLAFWKQSLSLAGDPHASFTQIFLSAGTVFAATAGPFMAAALILSFASHGIPSGWVLVPMKLHWERFNPSAGAKRILRPDMFWDVAKLSLKVYFMVKIVYDEILFKWDDFLSLGALDPHAIAVHLPRLLLPLGWKLIAANLAFAGVDLGVKLWQHQRKIKMTRQEVKEERKMEEGPPLAKGRIRSIQKRLAKNRSLHLVPKAHVIVVNPIHIAVALRYDVKQEGAPTVVAKGKELLAHEIIRIAQKHAIPIHRNEPLARSLYRSVEIGGSIPPMFYQAVAEVFAWVYRQRINQAAAMP